MRRPPPISDLPRYPVTGGTLLLATVASVAYWTKVDVTPLMETSAIGRGELWRLVTSALPHANVMHLAFDAYWTWVFGTLIERAYGSLKTAAIFVFLAAISGAAEYAVLSGGIGLSGVGYGLFAMVWVLSLPRGDTRFDDAVDQQTIVLFVAWFFLCIVLTVTKIMPIGNIAHGAGAAAGALLGLAASRRPMRRLGALGAVALGVVCITGATIARPLVNISRFTPDDKVYAAQDAFHAANYSEAARLYREVAEAYPDSAVNWYNLGTVLQRLKQTEDATAAYEKAVRLEPTNADYRKAESELAGWAGYDAMLAGHNLKAIRWFEQATFAAPSEPNYQYGLGLACENVGRGGDAAIAYQKAFALEPGNSDYKAAVKRCPLPK